MRTATATVTQLKWDLAKMMDGGPKQIAVQYYSNNEKSTQYAYSMATPSPAGKPTKLQPENLEEMEILDTVVREPRLLL